MGGAFCPYLPEAPAEQDWRALHVFRNGDRGGAFYYTALQYGQYLWGKGLPARAVLAVDRGLLAAVEPGEAVLVLWPLPYRALGWMFRNRPEGVFLGNLRVHYQHLADRVLEPRQAQKRARAWAAWHLVRLVAPELPGDARHRVREPSRREAGAELRRHGISGEVEIWERACAEALG